MTGPPADTPAEIPGVDFERLAAWMDAQGLPRGPITEPTLLGGGTQNILVRFSRGGRGFVLRRPPVHKRANSDETMRREARVLAALRGTAVPHPELVAACAETEILGASFYLMEPIRGFNPTQGLPALHAGDAAVRRRMGLALVDAIAALGQLDPEAVGLAGFGRPEGFLERQVARWRRQLEGYATLAGYPGPEIPGLDEVGRWLERNRPGGVAPGILHGDFHLANVLFSPGGPELAAIVDWELSTVGDPLLDLGWVLMGWPDPDAEPTAGYVDMTGMPSRGEVLDHYESMSGRSVDEIDYYVILAGFKIAIVLEGGYARYVARPEGNDKMSEFGRVVLERAAAAADLSRRTTLGPGPARPTDR